MVCVPALRSEFIHPSMEKLPVGFRLGAVGILTYAPAPFRLKACPTLPLPNEAPFSRVPSLPSAMSLALPSPAHQLIISFGTCTHIRGHCFVNVIGLCEIQFGIVLNPAS